MPALPPPPIAAETRPHNPAADAAARLVIDIVKAELTRRAPRPCRARCHAAAWGLLAQLDSTAHEAAAVPAHAKALKDALG